MVARFWLVWLGAVGVAPGPILSGGHLARPAMRRGGVAHGVLIADLATPFVDVLVRLRLTAEALVVESVVAVAATVLVYVGVRTGGGRTR